MSRDLPRPGVPGMLEQLSTLPPRAKIAVALVLIAMAGGAIAMIPESLLSWVLFAAGGMVGVPLLCQGLWQRHEDRVAAREMARARAELDELRREVEALGDARRGVERFLLERGYTSIRVRRWIALECGIVLPASIRLLR